LPCRANCQASDPCRTRPRIFLMDLSSTFSAPSPPPRCRSDLCDLLSSERDQPPRSALNFLHKRHSVFSPASASWLATHVHEQGIGQPGPLCQSLKDVLMMEVGWGYEFSGVTLVYICFLPRVSLSRLVLSKLSHSALDFVCLTRVLFESSVHTL